MRTKGGEGRLRWEERRKDENDHPREGREKAHYVIGLVLLF